MFSLPRNHLKQRTINSQNTVSVKVTVNHLKKMKKKCQKQRTQTNTVRSVNRCDTVMKHITEINTRKVYLNLTVNTKKFYPNLAIKQSSGEISHSSISNGFSICNGSSKRRDTRGKSFSWHSTREYCWNVTVISSRNTDYIRTTFALPDTVVFCVDFTGCVLEGGFATAPHCSCKVNCLFPRVLFWILKVSFFP